MRSPCSLCVSMCISLSLLHILSVKAIPWQRINRQQQKNCWTRRFLFGPWRVKKGRRLFLPITSCISFKVNICIRFSLSNFQLLIYMKNAIVWDVELCKYFVNRRSEECSSETSVHIRSTRRHIQEDGILHSHRCEYLKSYILIYCSMLFILAYWNTELFVSKVRLIIIIRIKSNEYNFEILIFL
jgi:hypothetical protein